LAGSFKLAREAITFQALSFAVREQESISPEATISRKTDFHGTLKLQAKVSETMPGWKTIDPKAERSFRFETRRGHIPAY
jgi:hypothetical protein